MKKNQWGKKNISLVVIIVLLAIAVFFDQSPDTDDRVNIVSSDNGKQSEALGFIPKNIYQAKLKRNQQIIASEDIIHKAYASIAIPYAIAMAEFKTFKYDVEINRSDAKELIRQLLPDDGSVMIEKLSINHEAVDNNAYQYMATIQLKIYTHESALSILDALGQYKNGTSWDSFSLFAHHKQKFFTLSGNLKILFFKAVE